MKKILIVLVFCLLPCYAQAQSVIYTYPVTSATLVQVNGYIPTLYVNGASFPLTHTCVLTTTVTPNVFTCTAPLPNITSALTPTGPQNFEVTLKDAILEGPKSNPPFVLTRPSVVSTLRIQ